MGETVVNPITQLAVCLLFFAVAWKLERGSARAKGGSERSRAQRTTSPPGEPRPRTTVEAKPPWPLGRDLEEDRPIQDRLSHKVWFTVTDAARALQNAPPGRKPSGSAGRDARALVDRWVHERIVELQYFGPSARPFYRFI
jgi:hypothetical protein